MIIFLKILDVHLPTGKDLFCSRQRKWKKRYSYIWYETSGHFEIEGIECGCSKIKIKIIKDMFNFKNKIKIKNLTMTLRCN